MTRESLLALDLLITKATSGFWEWWPHGDGYALMTQTRLPCGAQVHGLNLITVGKGGFDWNGENNREAIAALFNAWPQIREDLADLARLRANPGGPLTGLADVDWSLVHGEERPEDTALSKSIRKALTKLGIWVIRVQSGIIPAEYKGRKRFIHCAEPGTPDLFLVRLNTWLEVKTAKGELNEEQKLWHARARKEGVRVAVVRSVGDALTVARMAQADKRAA